MAGRVVGDVQLAVGGVGQPPGDVQPEAQPTGSRSGVPGTPRVPFEDALACIGWDARALVLDGQHRLGAVAAADQPDQRSWRAVGGGVVEQVAQDAGDGQRVDADQQRTSSIDGDPMVGVGELGGYTGLGGQRGRIDQRRLDHPDVEPVQAVGDQELLEQPLQLGALAVGDAEEFLLLDGGQGGAALLDGGQGAQQCGQGPAQLMGDHGQQLLGSVARRPVATSTHVGHRDLLLLLAGRGRGCSPGGTWLAGRTSQPVTPACWVC